MQLLDTLRFRRNLLGYPEETCISIYYEWVRGMQFFVVHPHHNETDESWDAQRYGMYVLNYTAVCRFMQKFRKSWNTGELQEIDTVDKWYSRDQVYELAYTQDNNPDDVYIYRLVVREQHWQFLDDRFVVDSLKHNAEHPALRELRGRKHVKAMLFPLEQAKITAMCLACINVESMWCNTNRKLFYQPEIVTQRALKVNLVDGVIHEIHWSDYDVEHFVGHESVLKFNGDFTDTTITKAN